MPVLVLAMALCLSVCLSVTSRCSIETAERIELCFGIGAYFHRSYTVLKGNSSISRSKGTSVWNIVSNSGLRKLCFGISIVERVINLARQDGRSERDKLDGRRRSTKNTSEHPQSITVIIKLCLQHDSVARVY